MEKQIRNICAIFTTIFVFIGFWEIQNIVYPIIVVSLLIIIHQVLIKSILRVNIVDVLVVIWLLFELYSFSISQYKTNSYVYLVNVVIIFLLYINIRFLNVRGDLWLVLVCFSAYIFLINFVELLFFFIQFSRITFYGFNDLTQFRFLFMPFGFLSNEWVVDLLLLLIFPLALYIYIVLNRKTIVSDNKMSSYCVNNIHFLVGLTFTINLVLFNILISFSRGGYVALGLVFIIISLLLLTCKKISFFRLIKYLLFLFIIPLIAAFFLRVPVIETFMINKSTTHERSTEGRKNIWGSAIDMVKENPINGIGTNNFALKYNSVSARGASDSFTGRIANTYLQLLVEKGIVGVFFYIFLFAAFIFFALRQLNVNRLSLLEKTFIIVLGSCFAGVAIREFTFSSIFFSGGITLLICVLIALMSQIVFSGTPIIVFELKKWMGLLLVSILLLFTFGFWVFTKENNSYTEFKANFNKMEFNTLRLINISDHDYIQNSYYITCNALNMVRKYEVCFNIDRPFSANIPIQKLDECIDIYKTAIVINSYDDNFYHNLGWLYFYSKNYDSAFIYINKAKKIESTISLYHISLGLMNEFMNQKDSALNEYSTALYLTPELIDSKFWKDLELKQPYVTQKAICKVKCKLEMDKNINDPILLSKKAKIYIYQKKYKKAKEILLDVTNRLPNLSRPWYNLGYLYELENNPANMIKCYNNALLNDMYYYMPCLRLAYYYDKIGFKRKAVKNYKAAINYWRRISSEHSQRTKALYFIEGVRDDIIPMGLLEYTKPFVDTTYINTRIRVLQNNKIN